MQVYSKQHCTTLYWLKNNPHLFFRPKSLAGQSEGAGASWDVWGVQQLKAFSLSPLSVWASQQQWHRGSSSPCCPKPCGFLQAPPLLPCWDAVISWTGACLPTLLQSPPCWSHVDAYTTVIRQPSHWFWTLGVLRGKQKADLTFSELCKFIDKSNTLGRQTVYRGRCLSKQESLSRSFTHIFREGILELGFLSNPLSVQLVACWVIIPNVSQHTNLFFATTLSLSGLLKFFLSYSYPRFPYRSCRKFFPVSSSPCPPWAHHSLVHRVIRQHQVDNQNFHPCATACVSTSLCDQFWALGSDKKCLHCLEKRRPFEKNSQAWREYRSTLGQIFQFLFLSISCQ